MTARAWLTAFLLQVVLLGCSSEPKPPPAQDTDPASAGHGDAGRHESVPDATPGAHDAAYTAQDDAQAEPPIPDPGDAGAASDAGAKPESDADRPDPPNPLADLPSKARIVEVMRLVNDHFIAGHPDGGNNLWARGVYFVGHMAAQRVTGDQTYLAYATGWAERHAWGLNGGAGTRYADNQVAAQTYLELNALAPANSKVGMIEASLSAMIDSAKVDDWWWCDALFMAMPAFTKLGNLRDDPRYFAKMWQLYNHAKNVEGGPGLYDQEDHLWWRDKGFVPPRAAPNGADIFWSRGNGWAFAALARTLEALPADDPHRADYEETFRHMAAALLLVQRSDGFWNASLHDPAHFGGPETSGTSLFSYGFAWGIRQGLLAPETYGPPLARAWHAMVDTAVHADGFLGFVQDVGWEPGSSQPVHYNTTSDFGVGVFLLANSELHALAAE